MLYTESINLISVTMGNLNKAMLIGRLGADPDVRYTQSNTAVATISLATSER